MFRRTFRPRRKRTDSRVIILYLLNILDGAFTLHFLEQGVEELNPIMEAFYGVSPSLFIFAKALIVAFALLFLDYALSSKYRWILSFLLAGYLMVFGWHLFGAYIVH